MDTLITVIVGIAVFWWATGKIAKLINWAANTEITVSKLREAIGWH